MDLVRMYDGNAAFRLEFPPEAGVNDAMELQNTAASPAAETVPQGERFNALLESVGKDKDKAAFAELFDYFAPRIKSFLMRGGAAPDAADELAQETMVTIWQRAGSFNPAKASASTWIYTIARNKRIDALRKQVRPELDPEDPLLALTDDAPQAGEMIDRQRESDVMAQVLQTLPAEQADLLYKSFFEDKTHADIAQETKLPLGTVKSRIRLALEKLRGDRKVNELWR